MPVPIPPGYSKKKEIGLKFDSEKLRYDLLPVEPIEELVAVLSFGAKKYKPNNWQKVDNAKERYYAAVMRHLQSYRKGEIIDPETGLSHLAHAMCNLVFLHHFMELDQNE